VVLKKPVAGQPTVTAVCGCQQWGGAAHRAIRREHHWQRFAMWFGRLINGEFSLLQNPTNIIFRSGIYTARVAVTGSNSNTAS